MPLDDAFLDKVRSALATTWGQIGADVENNVRDDLTNVTAVECCIDADHLMTFSGDIAADEAITLAISEHGYEKTLYFLAEHILLV